MGTNRVRDPQISSLFHEISSQPLKSVGDYKIFELPKTPEAIREVKDWLEVELASGPVASTEIQKRAKQAGHAWSTVKRAKTDLGIRPRKMGFTDGKWYWELPKTPTRLSSLSWLPFKAIDAMPRNVCKSSKASGNR